MTLFRATREGQLRYWARRTVVDHWLKGVLPMIVLCTIGIAIALRYPVEKAGVIAAFGITVGWLAAGTWQNVTDIREVQDR